VIVCHAYRYIFVKTRKTAGTSVEIALSKFCGPDDIITRDEPADEDIRASLGYPGPQNEGGIGFRHYRLADWWRFLRRRERARFVNHMQAERIRRVIGRDVWDRYFTFCVERDPWDKAVSLYFWRTRDLEPRPTLLEFLERTKRASLSNFDLYTVGGRLAVDRVVRYENLTVELEEVRTKLGLPEPLVLPRAKDGHRPEKSPYLELVGPREKAIIDRMCEREIGCLGYRFGDATAARGTLAAPFWRR
jgi:hypothetical protein